MSHGNMPIIGPARRLATLIRLPVLLLVLTGCVNGVNNGDPANDNTEPGTGTPVAREIDVTVEGQGDVDQNLIGPMVVLTATPDVGWRFVGWAELDSAENPVTIIDEEILALTAQFAADADGDGVEDEADLCPGTMSGTIVDANGCTPSQLDDDGDGVPNQDDQCPATPAEEISAVDAAGCSDTDGDGVANDVDLCPGTPAGDEADDTGCVPSGIADGDLDGVPDEEDECPITPPGAPVDRRGCTFDERDGDLDGVPDTADQCPTSPADETVNDVGCAPSERDTDHDGVNDDLDLCPDSEEGELVDLTGCPFTFEEYGNDLCADAFAVGEGRYNYANLDAATDGPEEAGVCGNLMVGSDLWFCYTATCTDNVTVSLCDSIYDTAFIVYEGCDCPPGELLTCDDDGCGMVGSGSVATFVAVEGQSYMIRVGGWSGEQGIGSMEIYCGEPPDAFESCGPGSGDCFEDNGTPGCNDPDCCESVCWFNEECCTVAWDEECAQLAETFCWDFGPFCGDGIVQEGEECDPPDGITCSVLCQLLTPAVCGNGIVEPGEQCDPPNGTTCDSSCLVIPAAGTSAWITEVDGYWNLVPTTYELDDDGDLIRAIVSIDPDIIGFPPENVIVLTNIVTPGADVDLALITVDDPYYGGGTFTLSVSITEFVVNFGPGNAVSWGFHMSETYSGDFGGYDFTVSLEVEGMQQGTVSGNGNTINWTSAAGTVTLDYGFITEEYTFDEYFFGEVPNGPWNKID